MTCNYVYSGRWYLQNIQKYARRVQSKIDEYCVYIFLMILYVRLGSGNGFCVYSVTKLLKVYES